MILAEQARAERPVYYGAPPETGLWKLSVAALQDDLSAQLEGVSFGAAIDDFIFGLDIAELAGWGRLFLDKKNHMSYLPKSKQFVSVGQLEWAEVKDLSPAQQFSALSAEIIAAVERVGSARRKPRDFDYLALAAFLRQALGKCELARISVPPEQW